jgi:hypothetical protein
LLAAAFLALADAASTASALSIPTSRGHAFFRIASARKERGKANNRCFDVKTEQRDGEAILLTIDEAPLRQREPAQPPQVHRRGGQDAVDLLRLGHELGRGRGAAGIRRR